MEVILLSKYADQEIHVEFMDEASKNLGELTWLDSTLAKRGLKAILCQDVLTINARFIVVAFRADYQ